MASKRFITSIFLSIFFLFSSYSQTPFTAEDALEVVSLVGTKISPDGKYIVAIRSKLGKNRLGVDHFRFGDASYLDVHLQTCDTVLGTGHFKVHVT